MIDNIDERDSNLTTSLEVLRKVWFLPCEPDVQIEMVWCNTCLLSCCEGQFTTPLLGNKWRPRGVLSLSKCYLLDELTALCGT